MAGARAAACSHAAPPLGLSFLFNIDAQVSDSFRRLHEVFYGNYRVEACALWRRENLPIAWHGQPDASVAIFITEHAACEEMELASGCGSCL